MVFSVPLSALPLVRSDRRRAPSLHVADHRNEAPSVHPFPTPSERSHSNPDLTRSYATLLCERNDTAKNYTYLARIRPRSAGSDYRVIEAAFALQLRDPIELIPNSTALFFFRYTCGYPRHKLASFIPPFLGSPPPIPRVESDSLAREVLREVK